MRAIRSSLIALALSSHPVPTVAVTAMATVLAVAAGDRATVVVLLLAAVLAGQLSIGWSNDLIDAARDRVAGRSGKPVAAGTIGRRALVPPLVIATVAVVPLSLALGWRAGAAHLVGVALGWAYNLGLKATVLSPVTYAIAFGALPAVATLARSVAVLPPWWVTAAAVLVGIGAHFGNVLPDIDDDRRAGVRGAPQRAGRTASGLVAAGTVVAAAALLLAFDGKPSALSVVCGVLVVALGAGIVLVVRSGRRLRLAFVATMLAAALCVAMIVLGGALAA
ncbi:UbiA family prenyltransferase [Amnibacterium sp.]|uniref:UbiA family prenyltransferase n=1 Tax=Amnibacterium sp. TaxID=1872496 RepID=UPI003F7C37E5